MSSLRRWQDFRIVLEKGRKFVGRYIVLYIMKNNQTCLRTGILVSKKFANAVNRNRARRVIREAFRHTVRTLEIKDDTGFDLVFIPRKSILTSKTTDVIPDIKRILEKVLI